MKGTIPDKGDIFVVHGYRQKLKEFFRQAGRKMTSRVRFALIAVAAIAVILPMALLMPAQLPAAEKQAQEANQWDDPNWNRYEDPREIPPEKPIEPLEPIPSLPRDGTPDLNGTTQDISGITQAYQQLQSQLNTCVQEKQQRYTEIASQYQQLKQLERQQDAVSDVIGRTGDPRRLDALNAQYDRYQAQIDRTNDAIADTQAELDNGIADCQQELSDAQARIDELEANLYESYDALLEYELPEYAY